MCMYNVTESEKMTTTKQKTATKIEDELVEWKNCCAGVEVAITRHKKANDFDLSGACVRVYVPVFGVVSLSMCSVVCECAFFNVFTYQWCRIGNAMLLCRCYCRCSSVLTPLTRGTFINTHTEHIQMGEG